LEYYVNLEFVFSSFIWLCRFINYYYESIYLWSKE